MKHIKLMLLVVTTVVVSAFSTKAQTGYDYVITFNHDTIKCNLQTQLFGLPHYEPLNLKNVSIKVDPDSIKEYCFHNGKHPFSSVKLAADKDREFLPCLEKGAVCLFESVVTTTNMSGMGGMGGMSTNTNIKWYASRGQDSLLNVIKTNQIINFGSSKKQRQKAFYDLIATNTELVNRFKDAGDYGFDAIQKAIAEFNLHAAAIK